MWFERIIVKQKEAAAIPDGDVILVIERETRDNGRRGKKREIIQKKRVTKVDRETGKRIGKPVLTERVLKEMPSFGEAIWDINSADTQMQIRNSVHEILKNQAAEASAQKKAKPEEDLVSEEFHRALKKAAQSRKDSAADAPAEPVKKSKPEPRTYQEAPDIWWM